MFDIGWTELLLIGIVALIVVGPKELPGMFRKMGQITGKARAMARDFQRAMDSAADEAGVKDIQRDLRKMTSRSSLGVDDLENSIKSGLNASDFTKDWSGKPLAPEAGAQQATGTAENTGNRAAKAQDKTPATSPEPVRKTAPAKAATPGKKVARASTATVAAVGKPAPAAKAVKSGAKSATPRSKAKAGDAPE